MKTIMTIIYIIFIIAILLYAAGLQLNFKPFSIKFTNLPSFFGIMFLIAAILCLGYDDYLKGYKKGYKEGADYALDGLSKTIETELNRIKQNETKDTSK